MALIKCRDCGHEHSKDAKSCPNCGKPVKKGAGCVTYIVAFFGLAVVLGAVGTANNGEQPPTTPGATTQATADKRPSTPETGLEVVTVIAQRLADNKKSLRDHYATADNVKRAVLDEAALEMTVNEFKDRKDKPSMDLVQKAKRLKAEVNNLTRTMFASTLEEQFMKNGIEMNVDAIGHNNTTLRLTYALMSQPLVYKFNNEQKLDESAAQYGFTKMVLTNGFESSLGRTWVINMNQKTN